MKLDVRNKPQKDSPVLVQDDPKISKETILPLH
jgi:hypothetical protein